MGCRAATGAAHQPQNLFHDQSGQSTSMYFKIEHVVNASGDLRQETMKPSFVLKPTSVDSILRKHAVHNYTSTVERNYVTSIPYVENTNLLPVEEKKKCMEERFMNSRIILLSI